MPIELTTSSVKETRALGEALAELLGPDDVVSLTGELGAGKTSFVQGAARGLGVESAVVSPTFTLVREYDGRLHVYHVDVYRLDKIQDVIDLGFEEMVDADGVTFIEWGDAIEALLGDSYLQLEFTTAGEADTRQILITTEGSSWGRRLGGLERATEHWRAP